MPSPSFPRLITHELEKVELTSPKGSVKFHHQWRKIDTTMPSAGAQKGKDKIQFRLKHKWQLAKERKDQLASWVGPYFKQDISYQNFFLPLLNDAIRLLPEPQCDKSWEIHYRR
jgi:hypothetical protein